jgi:hypothetical protein
MASRHLAVSKNSSASFGNWSGIITVDALLIRYSSNAKLLKVYYRHIFVNAHYSCQYIFSRRYNLDVDDTCPIRVINFLHTELKPHLHHRNNLSPEVNNSFNAPASEESS